MRRFACFLVVLGSLVGLSSASHAAVIIDFRIAVSSPFPSASNTLSVEIFLRATGSTSVSGYQFGITYIGAFSGANSLVNAPTHAAAGSWTSGGAGLVFDGGDGVIGAAISASTLTTPADDITAADGEVMIGSVKFYMDFWGGTADWINGCFDCDTIATGDGVTGSGDLTTNFYALGYIPEPTTAPLVVLGLAGFAAIRRRSAQAPRR